MSFQMTKKQQEEFDSAVKFIKKHETFARYVFNANLAMDKFLFEVKSFFICSLIQPLANKDSIFSGSLENIISQGIKEEGRLSESEYITNKKLKTLLNKNKEKITEDNFQSVIKLKRDTKIAYALCGVAAVLAVATATFLTCGAFGIALGSAIASKAATAASAIAAHKAISIASAAGVAGLGLFAYAGSKIKQAFQSPNEPDNVTKEPKEPEKPENSKYSVTSIYGDSDSDDEGSNYLSYTLK